MKEIQLSRLDLNLLVVFETLMLEGSVARAAERLCKTPSAISHALARLREQTGDPLMVRVNGQMQASPFALTLIDEVRPILRSIKRVMAPPEPFEPATSARVFRIAMPMCRKVYSAIQTRVSTLAPHVRLEWLPANASVPDAVSEGLIDIAHLGGPMRLPDGLEVMVMKPFGWVTFARKDHPAVARWGLEAWLKWPHIQVNISNNVRSPIDEKFTEHNLIRHVGALVPEFSGVASMVADTDLLATFPPVMLYWDMQTHGLVALKPPVAFAPFAVRLYWSARLANDPGSRWLRSIVLETYAELNAIAEDALADANLIQPV